MAMQTAASSDAQVSSVTMPRPARRRRLIVRAGATSIVTVGLLVLVWHLLGHARVWSGIQLQPLALALAITGATVFLLSRAWRFWLLLPNHRGSAVRVLGVTGAGWGAGLLLPGPSGDVAFVALARRALEVSIVRGSGIDVLARLFDIVSIAGVAVLAAAVTAGSEPKAVLAIAAIAGVTSVVLLTVMLAPGPRRRVLSLASRVPRVAGLAERADRAITELSSRRLIAGLIASTALCRVATAVQYAGLMSLVGLHLGFWQTWFVLSVRTLLFTIPVQGIAGIGTSQAWWTGALAVEGVPLTAAVAASVTLQALDLAISLPIAGLFGLLTLVRRGSVTESQAADGYTSVETNAPAVLARR
jgi:Lysylphosphatidylglycerol synthase TM region